MTNEMYSKILLIEAVLLCLQAIQVSLSPAVFNNDLDENKSPFSPRFNLKHSEDIERKVLPRRGILKTHWEPPRGNYPYGCFFTYGGYMCRWCFKQYHVCPNNNYANTDNGYKDIDASESSDNDFSTEMTCIDKYTYSGGCYYWFATMGNKKAPGFSNTYQRNFKSSKTFSGRFFDIHPENADRGGYIF